jgi:hypothetical protein
MARNITRQCCGTPWVVTFCAEHKKRHPAPSVNCGVITSKDQRHSYKSFKLNNEGAIL